MVRRQHTLTCVGLALLTTVAHAATRSEARPRPEQAVNWTVRVDSEYVLAPGAVQRVLAVSGSRRTDSTTNAVTWRVVTLTADARQCWRLRPLLATEDANAQPNLRELLRTYARSAEGAAQPVIGGVNGDFLKGEPNGVVLPVGVAVQDGRVLAGAWNRSHHGSNWRWMALALDSEGRYQIAEFLARGRVTTGNRSIALTAWNRYDSAGVTYFDSTWNGRRLPLDAPTRAVIVPIDLSAAEPIARAPLASVEEALPPSAGALVIGSALPPSARDAILHDFLPGQRLRIAVGMTPFHPVEAVGGYPQLVARGTVVPNLGSIRGNNRFLHGTLRRSAVGVSADGRAIVLAVVDGGEGGVQPGMTITEVATLMHALGTAQALNLDGSYSTALAVADLDAPGTFRLATIQRQRSTSLALAVVRDCSAKDIGARR